MDVLKSIKRSITKEMLNKIQLTPPITDAAEIFKSFLRRASITRKGGSITQPHVKQNFAYGSFCARHFVHCNGTEDFSGWAPHQSQKRASALFKRKHFEHVIIVPIGLGAKGTETVA